MNKIEDFWTAVIVAFAVLAVILVLLALPTMLLWNWLMPFLFGLPIINFWEALGINLLAGILFKSANTRSN